MRWVLIQIAVVMSLAIAAIGHIANRMHDLPQKTVRADQVLSICPTLKSSHELISAVSETADEYQIEEPLLYAVMAAESGCSNTVRSSVGAVGLMQLMPQTARWLGVRDIHSVRGNVRGGGKYLSYLLDKFSGNVELAVAAYNAGPQAVSRHSKVPPYGETHRYVKKVLKYYQTLRAA